MCAHAPAIGVLLPNDELRPVERIRFRAPTSARLPYARRAAGLKPCAARRAPVRSAGLQACPRGTTRPPAPSCHPQAPTYDGVILSPAAVTDRTTLEETI